MKKITAVLLVLVMLLAVLSACAPATPDNGTNNTENTTTTAITTQTSPTSTEITTPSAIVPENLSQTPAVDIINRIAPEARQIVSSTLGSEVILKGRDSAEDVIAAFTDAGYYDYPIDTIEGAKLTTNFLLGKNSTVTVYYQKSNREVRIAWENVTDFDHTILAKKPETDTEKLIFAQVGTERVGEKDNPLIGMIHIVKLSDGRAMIVDGGTGNNRNVENIYATLEKLDIAKDGNGRYLVAAWIITHAHGDHVGAATIFANTYRDKVTVEAFMYNFTRDAAVIGSSSDTIQPFVTRVSKSFPDAKHIVAHANMKYYFGNATVSVLYTPELIYRDNAALAYYNDSSLIFRISVGESSVFEIGDAGNVACGVLSRLYESQAYKSTVLQITHHGLYTESGGHTWNYVKYIYNSVDADLAVLPMQSKYASDTRNGRFTVMGQWFNNGYQISYVMNRRDRAALSGIELTQAVWDEFELNGTVNGKPVESIYGYDGKNTVTNADGLVTYLGSTRTTPMIVIIELDGTAARVIENRELYDWLG